MAALVHSVSRRSGLGRVQAEAPVVKVGPGKVDAVKVDAGKATAPGMKSPEMTDNQGRKGLAWVPDKDRLRGPGGDKVVAWGAVWDPGWDVVRGTEGVLVGVGDEVAVVAWVEADEGRDYKEQFSQHGSWTAAAPSITASRTCGVTFSLCTSCWLSHGLRSALGN
jgi:hypothetical protein